LHNHSPYQRGWIENPGKPGCCPALIPQRRSGMHAAKTRVGLLLNCRNKNHRHGAILRCPHLSIR
jgi:hypothetical protein